jgi:uncharacterized protein
MWSGLILGAAGSLHCAGMCGPLVIAATRVTQGLPNARLVSLLHQLGRITTYCLMGLTAGSFGRTMTFVGWQQPLTIVLGGLIIASTLLTILRPLTNQMSHWIGRISRNLAIPLKSQHPLTHFGLGLCHGLLPCGLVYIALATAAATGNPILGTIVMAGFGVGTLPMLLGIVKIQQSPYGSKLLRGRAMLPALATLAGLMLILRGLGLGIPYLSPKISNTGKSACCSPSIVLERPKNEESPIKSTSFYGIPLAPPYSHP